MGCLRRLLMTGTLLTTALGIGVALLVMVFGANVLGNAVLMAESDFWVASVALAIAFLSNGCLGLLLLVGRRRRREQPPPGGRAPDRRGDAYAYVWPAPPPGAGTPVNRSDQGPPS